MPFGYTDKEWADLIWKEKNECKKCCCYNCYSEDCQHDCDDDCHHGKRNCKEMVR